MIFANLLPQQQSPCPHSCAAALCWDAQSNPTAIVFAFHRPCLPTCSRTRWMTVLLELELSNMIMITKNVFLKKVWILPNSKALPFFLLMIRLDSSRLAWILAALRAAALSNPREKRTRARVESAWKRVEAFVIASRIPKHWASRSSKISRIVAKV